MPCTPPVRVPSAARLHDIFLGRLQIYCFCYIFRAAIIYDHNVFPLLLLFFEYYTIPHEVIQKPVRGMRDWLITHTAFVEMDFNEVLFSTFFSSSCWELQSAGDRCPSTEDQKHGSALSRKI